MKKHNTTSDCWSIVSGRVYNLSRYLNKHPGGVSTIKPICGKDGTSAFSGQHRGDSAVASVLNPYKIGTLR